MHTHAQDHDTTMTAPIGGTSEPRMSQPPSAPELTANAILLRIDKLIEETAYLRESVDALAKIESSGSGESYSPGDIGAQAKATAIASVIEQREQTNRKMIALLDRMYDDLSPGTSKRHPRTPEEAKLIERLIDQSAEMSEDTLRAFLESLA